MKTIITLIGSLVLVTILAMVWSYLPVITGMKALFSILMTIIIVLATIDARKEIG